MNRSLLFIAILAGALLIATTTPLRAATITVTTTSDEGAGSLRDALASTADGDTIDFSVAGTILLTNGELLVTNNVNITGPGPASMLVDGGGTNRAFHIGPFNTVSISGLTITNGFADGDYPDDVGGGIYSDRSTLTVSNCTLNGNSASTGGGGICSDGSSGGSATLTITNSTLRENFANYFGGGIYSSGQEGDTTAQIANTVLIGNIAGDSGGGIYSDGSSGGSATLTVTNSTLNDNVVSFSGGGICSDGYQGSATLALANSILNGNSADSGGAIFSTCGETGTATVEIAHSVLSSNSTSYVGGGICSYSGFRSRAALTIASSTLGGNAADYQGGAIYNNAEEGGDATLIITNSHLSGNSAESGGAIYNDTVEGAATVTMAGSTVSSNSAYLDGGAIYNYAGDGDVTFAITSSTLNSNSATNGGGAIYNDGQDGIAMFTITNSTLSGNSADSGGGIYNYSFAGSGIVAIASSTLSGNSATNGGGIFNYADVVEIGNTILNAGSGLNIDGVFGTVISHGHNLSSDESGGDGTTAPGGYLNATGDMRNTDPLLGPLQDNGGPTFTHALLPGSPAIDAGSDTNFPATDQRGVARPQIVRSDIGAFELEDNQPIALCKNVTVTLVSGCSTNVSIDNGSSDPDLGDTITLSQSPAGPYSVGTNTVTLTVTDSIGATNSCTATVIVVDSIAPTVTCPTNVTASATSPAGATVSLTGATASDNCSATVSYAPASGSTFPIGNTTVTCTARDAAGNTGTCTFTVRVKDAAAQLVDTERLIQGFEIDARIKKSILKKFEKAERQADGRRPSKACKQLQNLLRKMSRYLVNDKLTSAQTQQITTPIVQALTVLGCP